MKSETECGVVVDIENLFNNQSESDDDDDNDIVWENATTPVVKYSHSEKIVQNDQQAMLNKLLMDIDNKMESINKHVRSLIHRDALIDAQTRALSKVSKKRKRKRTLEDKGSPIKKHTPN